MKQGTFAARTRFESSHPTALAIYCSDGRFTDSVEELLHGLGHPRLDTLTMPGGPALLNLWSATTSARHAVQEAARFLIEKHRIRKVVLVAHEGCGYYRSLCSGETPEQIEERQRKDLAVASRELRGHQGRVATDLYYARTDGERVVFEPLET
ncbi:MAG TPA: carbonic anhydrase [Planctomycetota bacterium]|nr:carbonic anhydrase [Planctomycetota bacterium]